MCYIYNYYLHGQCVEFITIIYMDYVVFIAIIYLDYVLHL